MNIYVGEISPKQAYDFTTRQLKLEKHLAIALVNRFGGHIYDMYRAIESLHYDGEDYVDNSALDMSNVLACLELSGINLTGIKENEEELKERMRRVLKQLAVKGFAFVEGKIPFKDPIAECISFNNVGGVVNKGSLVIGLRDEVWVEDIALETGLIPSSQSIRIIIAKALVRK
jgi:hypothetical protein